MDYFVDGPIKISFELLPNLSLRRR